MRARRLRLHPPRPPCPGEGKNCVAVVVVVVVDRNLGSDWCGVRERLFLPSSSPSLRLPPPSLSANSNSNSLRSSLRSFFVVVVVVVVALLTRVSERTRHTAAAGTFLQFLV